MTVSRPPTRNPPPPSPAASPAVIVAPKNDTIMGAPKTALKIIIVNMILVSLLLGLLYLIGGGELRILPTLAVTVLGLALFQLALQFILWKLYWWLLGLAWSCFTLVLIAGLIGIATGAISLSRLPYHF